MWKKANRLKSTTFLDSFNSACFYEIFFPKTTDFSFFYTQISVSREETP